MDARLIAISSKPFGRGIIQIRPLRPKINLNLLPGIRLLHSSSMFAVKAKIYGVLYNQSSSITFDETSSYWSVPKSS